MATRVKSLDRATNSSQNGETKDLNKELEYWKNKAQELEQKKQTDFVYEALSPNDMVEVISLCYDKLNLNTKPHAAGYRYSFDSFGETKMIMYSELAQIKETQRNFARKGYFLINNPSAVRMLGLEEDYKRILNKEKIEEVLSNSPNAEKWLKVANEGQLENIIARVLIDKMVKGENVDMNLVYKVSQISKIDINQRVAFEQEALRKTEESEE